MTCWYRAELKHIIWYLRWCEANKPNQTWSCGGAQGSERRRLPGSWSQWHKGWIERKTTLRVSTEKNTLGGYSRSDCAVLFWLTICGTCSWGSHWICHWESRCGEGCPGWPRWGVQCPSPPSYTVLPGWTSTDAGPGEESVGTCSGLLHNWYIMVSREQCYKVLFNVQL